MKASPLMSQLRVVSVRAGLCEPVDGDGVLKMVQFMSW